MKKIIFILLYNLFWVNFFIIAADKNIDKAISVESEGNGTTRQDALHDAMKKAIIKAVGVYVTTHSISKDEDYKEQITMTSDAVITNYKETEAVKHNGMWIIKIDATILPNELLKYYPKLVSQDVSQIDIGNLINKRSMYQNADKALDEIFKDYYLRIFKFQKYGDLHIDSSDEEDSVTIKIQINFIASIDQKAFLKFKESFSSFLDKVALQKTTCKIYIGKNKNKRVNCSKQSKVFYGRIPGELGYDLIKKAGLTDFEVERGNWGCFVAIKHYKNDYIYYSLYLVPKKIATLIHKKLIFEDTYIGCSFYMANEPVSYKKFFKIGTLRYYKWGHDWDIDSRVPGFYINSQQNSYIYPFTFMNAIFIEKGYGFEIENEFSLETKGSLDVSIPVEKVKNMRRLFIYPLGISKYNGYDDRIEKERLIKRANEIENNFYHTKVPVAPSSNSSQPSYTVRHSGKAPVAPSSNSYVPQIPMRQRGKVPRLRPNEDDLHRTSER